MPPATFILSANPTSRYMGKCESCTRPVAATEDNNGDHLTITCPDCGQGVTGQRIYGTVNGMTCDARCESASGPICSCGCGGKNHGGSWIGKGTILADELKAYRDRLASVEAKREARATAERKRNTDIFNEWATEHRALADYFEAQDLSAMGGFMYDMAWTVRHDHKPLSPRRTEVAERIMAETLEREERKARERANAKPCPTGKAITVTGEVIHTRLDDNPFSYHAEACVSKMLVAGDGWKIWATIPRAIDDMNLTTPGNPGGLKGKRVRFVADVTASRDDVSFGIAKRPRQAEIIGK